MKERDRTEILNRVNEFRTEIRQADPAFVRESRLSYLESEIERLQKSVRDQRLLVGKELLAWGKDPSRKGSFPLLNDPDKARLEKLTKERDWLSRPVREELDPGRIEIARNYPLWRLLDSKPKGKVPCPFHADRHPSMHLYEENAYCFVCCKSVDSIGWLMQVMGLSFKEAVERLS